MEGLIIAVLLIIVIGILIMSGKKPPRNPNETLKAIAINAKKVKAKLDKNTIEYELKRETKYLNTLNELKAFIPQLNNGEIIVDWETGQIPKGLSKVTHRIEYYISCGLNIEPGLMPYVKSFCKVEEKYTGYFELELKPHFFKEMFKFYHAGYNKPTQLAPIQINAMMGILMMLQIRERLEDQATVIHELTHLSLHFDYASGKKPQLTIEELDRIFRNRKFNHSRLELEYLDDPVRKPWYQTYR